MAILVASAALLVLTLTLPTVKEPQLVSRQVPPTVNPPGGYEIHGYGIPPVATASTINVTLSGFEPGHLQYSMAPTEGNLILTPIAFGEAGDAPVFSFSAIAGGNYPLELTIIAYNGSGYSITYSGVWSPFDFLLVYTSPAVFLVASGLAATYYFGTRVPRQLNEEEVQAELERERRSKGTAR